MEAFGLRRTFVAPFIAFLTFSLVSIPLHYAALEQRIILEEPLLGTTQWRWPYLIVTDN